MSVRLSLALLVGIPAALAYPWDSAADRWLLGIAVGIVVIVLAWWRGHFVTTLIARRVAMWRRRSGGAEGTHHSSEHTTVTLEVSAREQQNLPIDLIAGYDPDDARQSPDIKVEEYTKACTGEAKGLRIGILEEGFGWGDDSQNTDAAVRDSAQKFRTAFNDLDRRLTSNSYYFGDKLSIIDIAWFVYASRLHLGGYPFERLHPNVHAWREDLVGDDRFAREVRLEDGVQSVIARNHADWIQAGTTLADVAGL